LVSEHRQHSTRGLDPDRCIGARESGRSATRRIGHFRSYDRSGNRDANDRFQSTAAIGPRPLEWARSPKQSLTVLQP
jgi:hypothetical protein